MSIRTNFKKFLNKDFRILRPTLTDDGLGGFTTGADEIATVKGRLSHAKSTSVSERDFGEGRDAFITPVLFLDDAGGSIIQRDDRVIEVNTGLELRVLERFQPSRLGHHWEIRVEQQNPVVGIKEEVLFDATVLSQSTVTGDILSTATLESDVTAQSTASGSLQVDTTVLFLNPSDEDTGIVTVSDDASLNPTAEITWEWWMYIPNGTLNDQNYRGFLEKIVSNNNLIFWHLSELNMEARFTIGGSSRRLLGEDLRNHFDTWRHYAFTYDGSEMRLYSNGNLVNSLSVTGSISTGTNDFTIGGNTPFDPSRMASAKYDDVRFWNVARTQTEIQDNMDATLSGNETGLVGYWRLDEGSGTTVNDSSTNDNTGTISGDFQWLEEDKNN